MMRAALTLSALAYCRDGGRTPPRVCKAVDQPLTQSTVGAGDPRIPWRRQTGSNSLLPKAIINSADFICRAMPRQIQHLSFQKSWPDCRGNRHDAKSDTSPMPTATPRPRRSLPYIPSKAQDPRFQTKAQGQARDQAQDHGFQDRREYKSREAPHGC